MESPFPEEWDRCASDAEDAYCALQERLQAYRGFPALNLPCTLELQSRYIEPSPMVGQALECCPQSCALLDEHFNTLYRLRPRPVAFDAEWTATTLSLTDFLYGGPDKFSQVYAGTLSTSSDPCGVVVKIYQESLQKNEDAWEWCGGSLLAQTESAAYVSLKDLQGTAVPWVWGFFAVRGHLPWAER